MDQRKTEVSLEEADCYIKPAITQDDETLKKDAEDMNPTYQS